MVVQVYRFELSDVGAPRSWSLSIAAGRWRKDLGSAPASRLLKIRSVQRTLLDVPP